MYDAEAGNPCLKALSKWTATILILSLLMTAALILHRVNILLGEGTERLAWQNIVLQSRFPQAVTALLAGASLAVSGLLLQTLFRNPLAGPSILGISDGANLGVAAIMLYFGGSLSMVTDLPISGYLAVIMPHLVVRPVFWD